MEDELLTVKEVAARLKVNPQTVRRWIRSGRLPARRYGVRGWRVQQSDVRPRAAEAAELTPEEKDRARRAMDELWAIREQIRRRSGNVLRELLRQNEQDLE